MRAVPWRPGRVAIAGALLLAAGCEPEARSAGPSAEPVKAETAAPLPLGVGFDFYVLALSWSPSYCAAEGEAADPRQCGAEAPEGFVVHGLWPQFERGFPENCPLRQARLPPALVRSLLDIMPSEGLVRYQWRKHGGCARLDAADYFRVLRAAWQKVVVPPEFGSGRAAGTIDPYAAEQAFIDANQGLTATAIAVTCDDLYLREVRICLTRELSFRPCPEVDRRRCRRASVAMPSVPNG